MWRARAWHRLEVLAVLIRMNTRADVSHWPWGHLPGSHSVVEALLSEPQGSPLSELSAWGVRGQEPRAGPQPQQLTVMLKDHTQQADLWGLHRTWAGLSNKAVYGLSVYLCPASGTLFTAYYSKTMTHWILNSNDRKLWVTKSQQSVKVFHTAHKRKLLKLTAWFISSPEKVHAQNSKAFKLLKFQTSCSEELIVLEGQQQQSGPLQILSRRFWRVLS